MVAFYDHRFSEAKAFLDEAGIYVLGAMNSIAYQDAIDVANSAQYGFLEAYLTESLFLYLNNERHHSSVFYLRSAIERYHQCGAHDKVRQLTDRLSVLEHKNEQYPISVNPSEVAQKRDVKYLFEAVNAIASELDFNELLSIIVKSVMARLGAKRGYLLIVDKSELVPHIVGIKKEEVSVVFRNDAEFSVSKLSMAIARYVLNSKQILILNNASDASEFVSDPTVKGEALRSILCLPIIKKTEVLGVLYLENSLIKSEFKPEEVELASLLTAQAAIALQNSKLINELQTAEKVTRANQLQFSCNCSLCWMVAKYSRDCCRWMDVFFS